MVLFAANQTFKISKLQKYMSLVNETWFRDVPRQHLSLAQKRGCELSGGEGVGEGAEGVEGVYKKPSKNAIKLT